MKVKGVPLDQMKFLGFCLEILVNAESKGVSELATNHRISFLEICQFSGIERKPLLFWLSMRQKC